jgi:hypothetical protein
MLSNVETRSERALFFINHLADGARHLLLLKHEEVLPFFVPGFMLGQLGFCAVLVSIHPGAFSQLISYRSGAILPVYRYKGERKLGIWSRQQATGTYASFGLLGFGNDRVSVGFLSARTSGS